MKTDPRVDADTVSGLNQKHNRMFLSTLRLLKYWNSFNTSKPVLKSYYFETLVGKVFGNRNEQIKTFPEAIRYFFKNGPSSLKTPCSDPKGYGPNLDANLNRAVKQKIEDEMNEAVFLCDKAIQYEKKGRHREAILLWQIIFGKEFPSYG
jgi:hypothetical protein